MKAFDTWEKVLLALLGLLAIVFGSTLPGFLSAGALADSSTNYSEKGLLALAMAELDREQTARRSRGPEPPADPKGKRIHLVRKRKQDPGPGN